MNRVAQSFRSESVGVDGASRNTHLHEQVGVSEWAIQDSKLLDQNHVADIENKENDNTHTQGGAKSAPSSCCTGRYREERGISSKVVSVERASRNTHLHEQVGASEWAIQDSNL